MPLEELENQGAPEPQPLDTPAEGTAPAPPAAPPKPDPYAEAIEAARRASEQAEQWSKFAAAQALESRKPKSPSPPEPEAPEDLDPALAAYLEGKIQQAVGGMAARLHDAYQTDRKGDLAYRANLEQERAGTKFTYWKDLEPAVKAYLGQLDPETQAAPGVVDEAYYACLGRKAEEDARAAAKKAPALAGGSRSPITPGSVALTPEEQALAAELGITPEDIKTFGGRTVSLSDLPQKGA